MKSQCLIENPFACQCYNCADTDCSNSNSARLLLTRASTALSALSVTKTGNLLLSFTPANCVGTLEGLTTFPFLLGLKENRLKTPLSIARRKIISGLCPIDLHVDKNHTGYILVYTRLQHYCTIHVHVYDTSQPL